jgi:hypothetical protein
VARTLSENPQSKSVELIGIAEDKCDFFCDQHGTPFAYVKNPGRVMLLSGREFKGWLVKQFYDTYSEAVGSDAFNAAKNVLEAIANEHGRISLSTRCSIDRDGRLMIDLANENEERVIISRDGWHVAKQRGPRFRRYSHMLPMEISAEGADLRDFVRFWRLKDDADDVLTVGYIGHLFVSDIPKAIHAAFGPKGSTKTSSQRYLRQLVDPSSVEDLTIAGNDRELAQQLAHHYVLLFDNVSRLKAWQADDLCRAATGTGFTKRGLYTDEDDVIFSYVRAILINGINPPTQRGDFLDRSLPSEYARVPRADRLEDSEVKAKMSVWLPKLRRTIFDALVVAIGLVDQVRSELKELPRMADFAVWGEAFCRAVGYRPLEFYNRLMVKVEETSSIALENDVIAELLQSMFNDERGQPYLTGRDEFKGTASALLKTLKSLNEDMNYVGPKELPTSPVSFGRHLRELDADLEEVGFKISRNKTTGGRRELVVRRVHAPPEGSKTAPLLPLSPLQATLIEGQSGGSGASGISAMTSNGDQAQE